MGVTELVFELLFLNAKIRSVAMVTYYVKKKHFITCSQIIGHFFDTTIKVIKYKDWQ